jgi:hypothetical protein
MLGFHSRHCTDMRRTGNQTCCPLTAVWMRAQLVSVRLCEFMITLQEPLLSLLYSFLSCRSLTSRHSFFGSSCTCIYRRPLVEAVEILALNWNKIWSHTSYLGYINWKISLSSCMWLDIGKWMLRKLINPEESDEILNGSRNYWVRSSAL